MTITIEVRPELQAELNRQATAQGVAVDAYAASLLEAAALGAGRTRILSKDELDRTLKDLSQFSHKIPLLPDEALSRESLYSDHD